MQIQSQTKAKETIFYTKINTKKSNQESELMTWSKWKFKTDRKIRNANKDYAIGYEKEKEKAEKKDKLFRFFILYLLFGFLERLNLRFFRFYFIDDQ